MQYILLTAASCEACLCRLVVDVPASRCANQVQPSSLTTGYLRIYCFRKTKQKTGDQPRGQMQMLAGSEAFVPCALSPPSTPRVCLITEAVWEETDSPASLLHSQQRASCSRQRATEHPQRLHDVGTFLSSLPTRKQLWGDLTLASVSCYQFRQLHSPTGSSFCSIIGLEDVRKTWSCE